MGIGAIGSVGSAYSSYRVSSVYGNPQSLKPVEKIGAEEEKSKPFAVLSKEPAKAVEEAADPKENQTMTVANDYQAEMERMMSGVRFSAESLMGA